MNNLSQDQRTKINNIKHTFNKPLDNSNNYVTFTARITKVVYVKALNSYRYGWEAITKSGNGIIQIDIQNGTSGEFYNRLATCIEELTNTPTPPKNSAVASLGEIVVMTRNYYGYFFSSNGGKKLPVLNLVDPLLDEKYWAVTSSDSVVRFLYLDALETPIDGRKKTINLAAQVKPADATLTTVTWVSTDQSVASVVGGQVLALTPGSTTIMCVADDNNLYDSIKIVVRQLKTGLTEFTEPADMNYPIFTPSTNLIPVTSIKMIDTLQLSAIPVKFRVLQRAFYNYEEDRNYEFYREITVGSNGAIVQISELIRIDGFETTLHDHAI